MRTRWWRRGKSTWSRQAVELPKKFGVPSGVGGHALDVVRACEQHGVKADFYIKTFHNHSYPTAPKPEQITGPLERVSRLLVLQSAGDGRFHEGRREAVDCVQDDGGGRDSAAASLPPGVCKRRRLRAGRHVRLRDCRRRANRPGSGGYAIATASGPGGHEAPPGGLSISTLPLGCHCWLAQQCQKHGWASQPWHP